MFDNDNVIIESQNWLPGIEITTNRAIRIPTREFWFAATQFATKKVSTDDCNSKFCNLLPGEKIPGIIKSKFNLGFTHWGEYNINNKYAAECNIKKESLIRWWKKSFKLINKIVSSGYITFKNIHCFIIYREEFKNALPITQTDFHKFYAVALDEYTNFENNIFVDAWNQFKESLCDDENESVKLSIIYDFNNLSI
uniref:Uncharacterized protein n=1 Tax=Meloidogyne javanica TaxID=6303 RepID=A0A915M6L4_MELJA